MSDTRLFEHRVGDITLRFLHDTANDRVGLTLYPTLTIQGGEIRWSPPGDFSACAALLSLSNSTEDVRLSRKELDAR
jgi:hypothetical protein